ncbi:winged helix-turn-helix domain-containing protein [Paenibacillus sp. FSL R10-2782]|uniref:helix-turn-helix domain-containing protein n=1 Tax=Paenibacillus sp. FSL R10-2782 TaxID=2954661 RepID=UPI0031585F38
MCTCHFFSGIPPSVITPELKPGIRRDYTYCGNAGEQAARRCRYTWKLTLIAAWIQREFGQGYTVRGVRKVLRRLGLASQKQCIPCQSRSAGAGRFSG